MKYFRIISGYCPEQDIDYSIKVTYIGLYTLGSRRQGYKKLEFYCEHYDEFDCSYENNRLCPLYNTAPHEP